ncbi:MAG: hypothetical protein RR382_03765 [Tannerellaceae bacterium]
MKKILTLFIIAFFAIAVKGEINLFSYTADGAIVNTNPKLIKAFGWESRLPLVNTESFLIKAASGVEYSLNLGQIPDPGSEGMFNCIQVLSGDKVLLTLKHNNAWEKNLYNNKSFIQIPLSSTCMALCFIGHCYDSTPPLLTIVVVNKNSASLVFNQECEFLSYINNDKEFSVVYTDQIQETNDDGSPYPATNQLKQWKIWKDGDMLKHTQIQ